MNMNFPVLLDGGLGQELYSRGIQRDNKLWSANALMSNPDIVRDVHSDFIKAGARIITTNTYCTTPYRLAEENMEDQLEALNKQACMLAIEARDLAGVENVMIAGSLPPLCASFRPDITAELATEQMINAYHRMIEVMAPHVDIFLAETMSSAHEAFAAASAMQGLSQLKWLSWSLDDEGKGILRSGESISHSMDDLKGYEIDAFLVNCCPPESIAPALKELKSLTDKPIGAYANGFSNIPAQWDAKIAELGVRKDLTPECYLEFVKDWLEAGASIIGGCCEIGPDHISVIHKHLEL